MSQGILRTIGSSLVALVLLGGGFFAMLNLMTQRRSAPAHRTAPATSVGQPPQVAGPDSSPATTPPQTLAAETSPAAPQAGEPATAPAPVPYQNPLTPEEQADGWLSLFDGHTLFGFHSNQPEVDWAVADGAITASTGPKGLLLTAVPFADYELRCEFRMSAGGNSGIFLRTTPNPTEVTRDCYELNIADAHPDGFTTGALVGRQATAQPILGSGDWKSFHVRVAGPRITVQLDGKDVLDYTDEAGRRSGLIGLQKNEGKIEFRKVLVKPLSLQPLFNGTDLAGWQSVPGSKSQFTVEEGVIRCRNGQGFIETVAEYGNFVVQIDARTHAPNLNSGFFFRAQPGTEKTPSNGYEVQIDNSLKDGDRHKPANSGTGAIFRRVEARYVVSSDDEWFTTTLVAHGPRFMVWVNGYAVVDWEDTRPVDDNPRKGRRTAPGHISLQGHDPTTDVSFRRLMIAELPE